MTTIQTTVQTPAEIAQILGYSGGVSPRQAGQFARRLGIDVTAADRATMAVPSGRTPLTLRALRMASRRLFKAEGTLRTADNVAGGAMRLSTPKVEFIRFGARHDVRRYVQLVARIDDRRKRLGLPRFMSDLTAAKVPAPAPDAPASTPSLTYTGALVAQDFAGISPTPPAPARYANDPPHADEHVDREAIAVEKNRELRRARLALDMCPDCGEKLTAWEHPLKNPGQWNEMADRSVWERGCNGCGFEQIDEGSLAD